MCHIYFPAKDFEATASAQGELVGIMTGSAKKKKKDARKQLVHMFSVAQIVRVNGQSKEDDLPLNIRPPVGRGQSARPLPAVSSIHSAAVWEDRVSLADGKLRVQNRWG